MSSLNEIQNILERIHADLPFLIQRSQISPKQVVIVNGLSDLSERLGLVQAGEFRAGNSVEPGFGFSGVRIGYPAFVYGGELWNIAGVDNDVLQFGLRASDGVAIAGGGVVTLDGDGIAVVVTDELEDLRAYRFVRDDGEIISTLQSYYDDVTEVATIQLKGGDLDLAGLSGGVGILAEGPVLAQISLTATHGTDNADRATLLLNAPASGQKQFIFNYHDNDVDFVFKDDAGADALMIDAALHKVLIYGSEIGGAAVTNAANVFQCSSCGASTFVGTIATLPGGAVLTYNVSSGNENVLVPANTNQLAKMRLYNTTRGTYALISNSNAGTNTITLTANVPSGWTIGDTITVASQTVNSGGVFNFLDLEITSGELLGKSAVAFYISFNDSGGAGQSYAFHPYESYALSKVVVAQVSQSTQYIAGQFWYKLTSNVITASWTASGANTIVIAIREAAYM